MIGRIRSIVVVLLGISVHTCSADSGSSEDTLVANLLDWLHVNGAYISEKLAVKHVVAGDQSSPRGIFATQNLDAGEVICEIPSKLIVSGKQLKEGVRPELTHCGAIEAIMEEMSRDDMTPYGRYLLEQPRGFLPGFWSKAGIDMLEKMLKSARTEQHTEYDELPPHGVGEMYELEEECNGDLSDPLYLHAAMLVISRADYEYMTPFYDMLNHDNRKVNIEHKFDPYKNQFASTGAVLVTTKSVKAGDQLYISYNQCSTCYDRGDWFGTPEMLLHYGFIEPYPQRWLIDMARVKFDLDGDEATGEVAVNFLVPPSEKGMGILQEELERLESFEKTFRSSHDDNKDISKTEWDTLWQYYDALHDAISYALKSDVTLSDEVWELGVDWWVKDGAIKGTDVHEHCVYPTPSIVEL